MVTVLNKTLYRFGSLKIDGKVIEMKVFQRLIGGLSAMLSGSSGTIKAKSSSNKFNFRTREILLSKSDGTDRKTLRTEDESVRRLDKKKLEALYASDASVKAGINLIANHMFPDFSIIGPNADLVLDTISTFDHDFDYYLKIAAKHAAIYGDGFQEIGYSKDETQITNLFVIDAKTMEFKKDYNGVTEIDEYQRPVGFVQTGRPQDEVIPYDKILHFKLDQIADSEMGIGLIEPLASIIVTKANIELGLGQVIYRKGFPFLLGIVGDETHHPTASMVDDLLNELIDLTHKDELVIPYYYKVEFLESANAEKLASHLDYFLNQICAGLGIPKPMLFGTGEDTNKATLMGQLVSFDRSLKAYQRLITREYERKLFRQIVKLAGGNPKEIPELIFAEINPEDSNDKATRLFKYVKSGLLTPSPDIEQEIRRREGFQLLEVKKTEKNQSREIPRIIKGAWRH